MVARPISKTEINTTAFVTKDESFDREIITRSAPDSTKLVVILSANNGVVEMKEIEQFIAARRIIPAVVLQDNRLTFTAKTDSIDFNKHTINRTLSTEAGLRMEQLVDTAFTGTDKIRSPTKGLSKIINRITYWVEPVFYIILIGACLALGIKLYRFAFK